MLGTARERHMAAAREKVLKEEKAANDMEMATAQAETEHQEPMRAASENAEAQQKEQGLIAAIEEAATLATVRGMKHSSFPNRV